VPSTNLDQLLVLVSEALYSRPHQADSAFAESRYSKMLIFAEGETISVWESTFLSFLNKKSGYENQIKIMFHVFLQVVPLDFSRNFSKSPSTIRNSRVQSLPPGVTRGKISDGAPLYRISSSLLWLCNFKKLYSKEEEIRNFSKS